LEFELGCFWGKVLDEMIVVGVGREILWVNV
jgi:hypothetical protein